MDLGCGDGSARGRDDKGLGLEGSERLKRKFSDLDAAMKAVTDEVVKENAEKSAKIRRLMEDNILLEETVVRLENPSILGEVRPEARPNQFAVFPTEVWEMIIEKMSSASDLGMLCLAFPQLEPSVKKTKKTLFLFEKVLPFVCEHLDSKDINNCRLVCEKWNQDVCTFHANWNAPNIDPDYPPPHSLQYACNFDNHTKIQKFLMKMADYRGNPFFGRFLRLYMTDQTETELLWKSALELVEKFGEHVWTLKIDCFRDRVDPIAFYKALQETLIHLPNLRNFSVFVDCDFCGLGPSRIAVAAQIGSSPLPPLPYLQSLKLTLQSETGTMSAFSPLFSQQIRRLQLVWNAFASGDLKEEQLRGLTNLEHLEVELKFTKDIQRLLKFPSSKLRKLLLDTGNYSELPVSINSGQVLNLLEKFNRLEYLDLIYCRLECNSSLSSEMRFPSLKTLKIGVVVHEDDLQHSLDFLLWFSSLKHLVIFEKVGEANLNVDEMDTHSTLKIRHCLFTSQMLDSNIWTLIPSLELLEITGCGKGKFTREMFENRRG